MRVLVVRHADGGDPGVLAQRARERGDELVFCAPHAGDVLPAAGYDAIVVLGGSVNVVDGHPYLRAEIEFLAEARERVPVLGVCLGAQLLAASAGGRVVRAPRPEIGFHEVRLTPEGRGDPLLGTLPRRFDAYQWHSYTFGRPSHLLADSDACPQAFRIGECSWGVQFHPEVDERILEDWFAGFRSDPDAVELGFEPAAARAELPARLPQWNALGGRLFDRFLALAAGRAALAA